MHADETPTDVSLVRRLLTAQFPEWAALPIAPVPSSGTVNALYRLGDDLVARLPRTGWGVGVAAELEWLPKLAPLLPVEIPVPLAKGEPAEGYPWEWGVYPWLAGEHPVAGDGSLADDLAGIVHALQRVELAGTPHEGRGGSEDLTQWDDAVRKALVELAGVIDTKAAEADWDACLEAAPWPGPPVWIHGDLMPANLLVRDGKLAAVIDWGGFGLGDPAVDLMVAWTLLPADARDAVRAHLAPDEDTWTRGRGWALASGLVALPYYVETNPELAENARYRIGEILAEAR
jgi:aminoglycoside phosphotransferase (APT) family kinase protein